MRSIFLLFLVALAFSSCVSYKEPVFNGIENIRMNKLAKGKSIITLQLNCTNPNGKTARLTSAEGDAWMDSTFLGHFTVDEAVDIPANSHFLVPVKLEVDMKNMIQHSLSAYLNDSVMISVKGKARVGRKGLYKRIPIEYKGMQKLQDLFKM